MNEDQFTRLMQHLAAWLRQQPEWPLVLAMPRHERKVFGKTVGDIVARIPTVDHAQPVLLRNGHVVTPTTANRSTRRHKLTVIREEE